MKVGRNDPCPCGSGKKYKKCCLTRERQAQRKASQFGEATSRAVAWLEAEHPDVVHSNMLGGYFGVLDEAGLDTLGSLPQGLRSMMDRNFQEWLLAEGLVEPEAEGGEPRPVLDLVLGTSGLVFDAEVRGQLEELGRRSLSLYEVDDPVPGEGIRMRDLLTPEAPPLWVRERTASRQLSRWDVMGARLIHTADEAWIFSGAFYPVPRFRLGELREHLLVELEAVEGGTVLERSVRTFTIVDFWLGMLTASQKPPDLFDTGSGDPLEFVTDHYEVRDREGLEAALAACDDVARDPAGGWVRLEEREGDYQRTLLSINPGDGDRLELFGRTRKLADAGRSWFAEIAGSTIRFVRREIVDPRSEALADRRADEEDADEIPMTTEIMQQVLDHFYRDWADKPLPALGDQTPRQAIGTPEGKERVVELLKTYEHGEVQRARDEGREPASLRFLWDELGLDREGLLR